MATKNLARTAIEGGRYHGNCWDRRRSNGVGRARLRSYLDQVRVDPSIFDERAAPDRDHVGKSFRDKLGPPMRWLDRHVGQRWDDVFSELLAKFDPRTLAGWHIVFDHMLKWVALGTPDSWTPFAVNAQGVLERNPDRWRWRRGYKPWRPDCLSDQILRWLAGRKVRELGDVLFWCEPTGHQWLPCPTRLSCFEQEHRTLRSGVVMHRVAGPRFRQAQRLSTSDLALWRSLTEGQKKLVRYQPAARG